MSTFNLPDLGEGLQEAEIVTWHVAQGDHVVVDQPLLSVETEKAVVEIPSPRSGHIAQLLARQGERVKVGAPLLAFEEGPHAQAGTVVGELAPPAPRTAVSKESARAPSDKIRAAPAVRARAKELGINLSQVAASGPDGTITLSDIEAGTASKPPPDAAGLLRGARRAMAVNMARAHREVASATLHDEADIDAWRTDEDTTVRLIRALIAGCTVEPSLNARFDATTLTLQPNSNIDIGLAIDSPDGLFVPVLRDVGKSPPAEWRRQIEACKQGVRDRSLTPAQLRNPTITLSNFGIIAGLYAELIIVPPQVAILGAGRIVDRPVRGHDGIILHRMLPLSLTFDHRPIIGGEAARFLRAIIADLQLST